MPTLLKTYLAAVRGLSTEAIQEAAFRFIQGKVSGHNPKFAPSVPEFVIEAEQRQKYIELRKNPPIQRPALASQTPAFMRNHQALLEYWSDHEILFEGVDRAEFIRLSLAGEIPKDATHIWQLDTIFGARKVNS